MAHAKSGKMDYGNGRRTNTAYRAKNGRPETDSWHHTYTIFATSPALVAVVSSPTHSWAVQSLLSALPPLEWLGGRAWERNLSLAMLRRRLEVAGKGFENSQIPPFARHSRWSEVEGTRGWDIYYVNLSFLVHRVYKGAVNIQPPNLAPHQRRLVVDEMGIGKKYFPD